LLHTKYSKDIEQKMKAFFTTLNEKDRRHYAGLDLTFKDVRLMHQPITKIHSPLREKIQKWSY
jgi:hypothetical protein